VHYFCPILNQIHRTIDISRLLPAYLIDTVIHADVIDSKQQENPLFDEHKGTKEHKNAAWQTFVFLRALVVKILP